MRAWRYSLVSNILEDSSTPCLKKLGPLLLHRISALTATNCVKISRCTYEVLLVVNME